MGLVDTHTHILPDVDDGAKNFEEAIALLEQEKENGVTSVVLTPHFYPAVHSFNDHYNKCKEAFSAFKEAIKDKDLPDIYLGFEVQYFSGISRSENLEKLCLENTNILLLEIPFLYPLTDNMINEIIKLDMDIGMSVIIAHIERYGKERLFKKLLKAVADGHAKAQISADFVTDKSVKKVVYKLLKNNLVSYIASDCHDARERPVMLKKAFSDLRVSFHPQIVTCIKNSTKLENQLKGNFDDSF